MNHPLSLFKYCPRCGSAHFEINDEKSRKCIDCGFVYYLNPSSAVAGFIVDEKERLMVCRRALDPAKGTLDLPGGFSDIGDTLESALIRELKEELNLDAINLNYLFSLPNKYRYCGFDVPTLDSFFECRVASFEGLKAQDDVAECFFVNRRDVQSRLFGLESVRNAVERWLNM
jgi:ADP-ribose pyrophosphatase YjhB (NUDIX family)